MPGRAIAVSCAAAGAIVAFGLIQTAIASAGQVRGRPAARLEVLTQPEVVFSGWLGVAVGVAVFAMVGAVVARSGVGPWRAAMCGALAMFAAQAASAVLQPLVFPTAELLSVPPVLSVTWFIHGIAVAATALIGTPIAAAIAWTAAFASGSYRAAASVNASKRSRQSGS